MNKVSPMGKYTPEPDPHGNKEHRWLGKRCSFFVNDCTKPLVGIVESARYLGRTERSGIPDYLLTIRGASGATREVSLVENRCLFPL